MVILTIEASWRTGHPFWCYVSKDPGYRTLRGILLRLQQTRKVMKRRTCWSLRNGDEGECKYCRKSSIILDIKSKLPYGRDTGGQTKVHWLAAREDRPGMEGPERSVTSAPDSSQTDYRSLRSRSRDRPFPHTLTLWTPNWYVTKKLNHCLENSKRILFEKYRNTGKCSWCNSSQDD